MHEWAGGWLPTPLYVDEGGARRLELILWLELPQDLIVGSTLIDPVEPPPDFTQSLLDAMKAPAVGPPRRPGRVRVADARLAAEVEQSLPDIDVVVAPTPELDRVVRLMAEDLSEGEASYLTGDIDEPLVERLFIAAKALFEQTPWKIVGAEQPLRLDVPSFGVEGACVAVIGQLGESHAVLLFPSLDAYDAFGVAADRRAGEALDLGAPSLSLSFEHVTELPETMRREAASKGWPVAALEAYPWVHHRERDGTVRPLSREDVELVALCARGLARYLDAHAGLFALNDPPDALHETYEIDGIEVQVSAPYEE